MSQNSERTPYPAQASPSTPVDHISKELDRLVDSYADHDTSTLKTLLKAWYSHNLAQSNLEGRKAEIDGIKLYKNMPPQLSDYLKRRYAQLEEHTK